MFLRQLVCVALFANALAHECICEGDLGLYTETNEYVACDSIDRSGCDLRSIRNRCCVTCKACEGGDDNRDDGGSNSGSNSGSSSSSSGGDDCFAGSELVLTNKGMMEVRDLPHHDDIEVEVVHSDGSLGLAPLQIWLHKSPGDAEYLEISTENGNTLVTTPTHIVYTVPCEGEGARTTGFASRITPGQCVLTKQDAKVVASKVTKIESAIHPGRYAFTTSTGNVVVSNVLASCYSIVEFDSLQHYFFQMIHFVQGLPGFSMVNSALYPMARDALNPIAEMLHESAKSLL